MTAAGVELEDAAGLVGRMAGRHRIPDALRLADRLARGQEYPARPYTDSQWSAGREPMTREL